MRLTLFLNHACNLRCRYCYNGRAFDRAMPLDVARRGIELMLRHQDCQPAPAQLSFFGGEPLLELELLQDCVEFASARARQVRRGLRMHLVSNGTLLEGRALELVVQRGLFVALSLDGDRVAHDAGRRYPNGRSSHARCVRNLQALLRRAPTALSKVIAVVTPANVEHLARSFDYLLELGVCNLSMNLDYQAAWTEPERERFVEALRALGERYLAAYRAGRRFTLNLLDSKIVTHVLRGYAASDRCDFGCQELAIAPSGRLYPCDRLVGQDDRDELVIGDVWSGVDVARRDALIARKNRVLPDCQGCALRPRCMYWCGCVNHAMTGRVDQVAGLLCWFEQRLIEEADRCASALHTEGNTTFRARFYSAPGA